MTDTQEQTLPDQAVRDNAPAAGGNGSAGRPAAKRGSLSAMLLPELQQVASGLGISTTKKKKSDLVAAIQAARSDSAGASSSAAASPTTQRPVRRGASAAQQAAPSSDAPTAQASEPRPDSQAEAGTAPDTGEQGGHAGNGRRSDQQSRQGQAGSGQTSQNNQAVQARQQGQAGGQNNQNRQQGQNAQNSGAQNNQNRQQGQNQGGQNNNNSNDDDDFDGNRRRGRRYRDRRGRNRERVVGGEGRPVGNTDVEPTVSDDDVLVPVAGIVDAIEDKNTWFVRTSGYFASSDDVYIANSYVRRFGLRRGDTVTGAIKAQRDGERREKYNPLVRLDTINGADPELSKGRVEFTKLTPLYPQERLRLETEPHIFTTRVIDLVMPIGKGQRALIASPPKAGKTSVLQAIANAIATNNPEVHLMVVLVDERPEEVTDMQRSVKGEVIASTFDRKPQEHTMIAELSIERAKRLVEMGHDVVVLLDSITRLGRAYNLAAPASGRILSGGVDSTALYPPKRFLGAARNIEDGGSLTIIATALVETGSAGDSVIYEEFKGTGNAELKLDRKIADKRTFPAIDVDQSGTRKEEILLSPDELAVTIKLRRVLHALESQQAIDLLLDRLKKTRTNLEFLMQIAKTAPGSD
ncbi:MAG: transcription termination factor Rho [Actinomycetota bacterium]|nr:transcription termination factor Rho [Actinomycetota bacterium]